MRNMPVHGLTCLGMYRYSKGVDSNEHREGAAAMTIFLYFLAGGYAIGGLADAVTFVTNLISPPFSE